MNQFIIDTSVGIKWFFQEPLYEKSRIFLALMEQKEIKMIVPEFFYCEFASVSWKKVKNKLASVDQAIQALDHVVHLPLERYSDHELSDVALENALRFNISVYDGLYLALAEIYVAPLVTADQTLLKACQGRFDFIESLQDFEAGKL